MATRPKRPLSAYMLWLNENREAIKAEHPGIKVTEIAKRGGELWRGLGDKSVSIHGPASFALVNCACRARIHRPLLTVFCPRFPHEQEWEKKAVEAKERYTKLVKEFEANGGDRNAGVGKKRSKGGKKTPAKKGKKQVDSDDDEEEEDSD